MSAANRSHDHIPELKNKWEIPDVELWQCCASIAGMHGSDMQSWNLGPGLKFNLAAVRQIEPTTTLCGVLKFRGPLIPQGASDFRPCFPATLPNPGSFPTPPEFFSTHNTVGQAKLDRFCQCRERNASDSWSQTARRAAQIAQLRELDHGEWAFDPHELPDRIHHRWRSTRIFFFDAASIFVREPRRIPAQGLGVASANRKDRTFQRTGSHRQPRLVPLRDKSQSLDTQSPALCTSRYKSIARKLPTSSGRSIRNNRPALPSLHRIVSARISAERRSSAWGRTRRRASEATWRTFQPCSAPGSTGRPAQILETARATAAPNWLALCVALFHATVGLHRSRRSSTRFLAAGLAPFLSDLLLHANAELLSWCSQPPYPPASRREVQFGGLQSHLHHESPHASSPESREPCAPRLPHRSIFREVEAFPFAGLRPDSNGKVHRIQEKCPTKSSGKRAAGCRSWPSSLSIAPLVQEEIPDRRLALAGRRAMVREYRYAANAPGIAALSLAGTLSPGSRPIHVLRFETSHGNCAAARTCAHFRPNSVLGNASSSRATSNFVRDRMLLDQRLSRLSLGDHDGGGVALQSKKRSPTTYRSIHRWRSNCSASTGRAGRAEPTTREPYDNRIPSLRSNHPETCTQLRRNAGCVLRRTLRTRGLARPGKCAFSAHPWMGWGKNEAISRILMAIWKRLDHGQLSAEVLQFRKGPYLLRSLSAHSPIGWSLRSWAAS
jgi:hypothetical protein